MHVATRFLPLGDIVVTDIPARLDRLPWDAFILWSL